MKKEILKSIENIFKINLGVKKDEKVIILTDNYNNDLKKISNLIKETGEEYTANIKRVTYKATGCHGADRCWIRSHWHG